MNIDELTIGQAREIAKAFGANSEKSHSFEIGSKYLIRTVTMMYTGRLKNVTDSDLLLYDAAWIADSGRYTNALETGELCEVEPYLDEVLVSRASIVDATTWNHDLPREIK